MEFEIDFWNKEEEFDSTIMGAICILEAISIFYAQEGFCNIVEIRRTK